MYQSPIKLTIGLFLVLAIINVRPSLGQTNSVEGIQNLSLTQSIQMALANAPEIKQALFDVQDADQQVLAAWGELLPTVDANINYQRNLKVPVNFIPEIIFNPQADPESLIPVAFGTDNNWQGGFQISQTLFRGEAFVGISTSELYKTAQQENYRAVAQKVVTDVRLAYYAVLMATENLELQKSSLNRLKANLEETQSRVNAGVVDDYEALRLKVQVKNEEPNLFAAENAISQAKRRLNILLGLPVQVPVSVSGNLTNYSIDATTGATNDANKSLKEVDQMSAFELMEDDQLKQIVLDFRGDLRSLNTTIQLQDKRILADKAMFLPTLSASYSTTWNAAQAGTPVFFGNSDQRARADVLGISMQWNLFNGFKSTTQLQRSKIEKRSLMEQQSVAVKSALNETKTAIENIKRIYQVSGSVREGVELARTGYRRAVLRQQKGAGSQLEVTEAELQLRQAEVNYAQMIFDYLSAKANYDFAIGKVPFVSETMTSIK